MVYPTLMFPLFFCRLFDWIVDFINSSIKAPAERKHSFIGNNEIIVSFSFLILISWKTNDQKCITQTNLAHR